MQFNYVGPHQLKNICKEEYFRIAEDYNRESCTIVIGLPRIANMSCCPSLESANKKAGFNSQHDFNNFLRKKIDELASLKKKARKGLMTPARQNKHDEIVNTLAMLSFGTPNVTYREVAAYHTSEDALILDAMGAITYYFNKGSGNYSGISNIPALMKHELVHHDLGLSVPYTKLRKCIQQRSYTQDQIDRIADAVESGVKFEIIREINDFAEFLHSLGNPRTKSEYIEKMKIWANRVSEHELGVDKKMRDLYITVGNDALAYRFMENKDDFALWMQKCEPELDFDRAMALYDTLGKRVDTEGKRTTLKEVEEAMNASFVDSKDFCSFFLS